VTGLPAPARKGGGGRDPVTDLLFRLAVALGVGVLATILLLPIVAVLWRTPLANVVDRLAAPAVMDALRLSVVTSLCATLLVVLCGTPVAYLLATRRVPGRRVVEALIDLPIVLPPTVAGFALLLAFGRNGLLGGGLQWLGVSLPFSTAAVVLAQVFMAAPFFVAAARAGFAGVDRRYLDAAGTLRASEARTFTRIMLPLSAPSLVAGTVLAWARALGEFGATITFAGNLPGRTQTMPLAVYLAMQTDLDAALALSFLLVLVALALLIGLRSFSGAWWLGRGRDAPRASR
jgi:molybdate transport system permease protein